MQKRASTAAEVALLNMQASARASMWGSGRGKTGGSGSSIGDECGDYVWVNIVGIVTLSRFFFRV